MLILGAASAVHAQSCSGMSLGNDASLNGFVPFPSTNAWNTNIYNATVDSNSAAIVSAGGFTGLATHVNFGSSSAVSDHSAHRGKSCRLRGLAGHVHRRLSCSGAGSREMLAL
jgi:hypothetical protein